MLVTKLIAYFTLLLYFTLQINCKNKEQTIVEIPIHWEYASANANESPSLLLDKIFIPLEDSKIHTLSSLLEGGSGYLWLRANFSYQSNGNPASISLGKIIWAEEVFLNNQLIGSTISSEQEQWNFWNYYRNYPLPAGLVKETENSILVRLYVNGEGSITNSISIGNTKDIDTNSFRWMFFESYINGVIGFLFLVISLYHLLIYIKRKKDNENLYYAIFCFSYSVYSLNFISWFFPSFFTFSYILFQKIIFISLFVSTYSFYKFISVFLKRNDRKWFSILYAAFAIIPIVITILSPDYRFMYRARGITILFTFPFIFYVLFIPVYNFFKYKNPEARAMLGSLIIVFIVAFHDIANVLLKWEQTFWIGLGIPAFMGSIMFLLGSKFVAVHNETDELNETLESKVVERTREVMEKMDVIKALNIQQDGDYYLTSLIEKPLGTNYNKSKNVKTDFYIEQKKKFQFKTRNSELGGDICISGNLRFGDGKDRFVFFFNGDAMGKSMQGAGGAIVAGTVVNSILARSAKNNKIQKITPKEWITETYLELDSVFKTFDGSMLMSCACGVINEKTGQMWYFNAEHPWSVIYRDGKAEFIESALVLRKLGTILEGNIFQVQEYQFLVGDIFFVGSDGRDDLDISHSDQRDINEDETRFLRAIEIAKADLNTVVEEIHKMGKVTDDLSLIRIHFDNAIENSNVDRIDSLEDAKKLINLGKSSEGIAKIVEHLESAPDDLNALELLSNFYYQSKDYSQASLYLHKILEFFPNDSEAISNISLCYKYLKNYKQSILFAEKLLELQPKKISNVINLADNYRIVGDFLKSRECLNNAMDSIPFFENAIKLDKILKAKGF